MIGKVKAELKLDAKAYDELCEAFIELNNSTEDMPWLNDAKQRMVEALKGIKISIK